MDDLTTIPRYHGDMRLSSVNLPGWWPWSLGVILLAAIVAYAPALPHPLLHFDDAGLITNNTTVQEMTPRTIAYAFSSYDPELYIPLTFLSYQISAAVFGMSPIAFHATNLLLHLLSVLCVALLVLRLTKMPVAAIVAAAMFALHPLNAEAVLWASARKDVLSSFLSLASILVFLRYRDSEHRGTYVGAIALFLLALLAKVHAIVVLPLLLLIDMYEGRTDRRELLKTYAPYLLLAVVFGIVAIIGKFRVLGGAGMDVNILLLIKSAAFYLQMIVWPVGLSLLYPQGPLSAGQFILPIVILVALIGCAWWIRRRWPIVTLGIAWYLIALVPSIAGFTKNEFLFFASDRFAYLALVGIAVIVGWTVGLFAEKEGRTKPILALCFVLAGLLTWRTAVQARVWMTEESLFQNAVTAYPSSALGWNNLGAEQMLVGKKEEAVASFQKAIDSSSSYTVPYRNLAHIAFDVGDITESLRWYEQAANVLRSKTQWSSDDVSTFASYALLLENVGRSEDGFTILVEAAERAPQFGDAHYNVGIKLQERRKLPEALLELQQAVDLSPQSADAWYHYAGVAAELGRLPEALDALEHVLWLDPTNENAKRHYEAIRGMVGK